MLAPMFSASLLDWLTRCLTDTGARAAVLSEAAALLAVAVAAAAGRWQHRDERLGPLDQGSCWELILRSILPAMQIDMRWRTTSWDGEELEMMSR